MATERIDIVITQQGGQPVINVIHQMGTAGRSAATSMDFLQRALSALAGALAIDKVREYADAWAVAAGKVAIATKTQVQAAAVLDELFRAAQKTGIGISETVDLYTKLSASGKELGVTQQRIIDFTEGVGKALAIQGTSAGQAKGALLQLGQALGSGIVRAQEFNSVLDGARPIIQTVANNIKGVDGSIAKLREMMKAGKLTSKEFFDAFEKGAPELQRAFEQAPVTIGRALTQVENAITKFIGTTDKQFGVSSTIAKGLKFIADNFDQIGKALLVFGAAVAGALAPGVILGFANAFRTLFAVIAANPFIALGAAIAGALAYIYLYGDTIDANAEGTASLKDVLIATGETAGEAFKTLGENAVRGFNAVVEAGQALANDLGPAFGEATKGYTDSFKGFFDGVGTGFEGVARGVARVLDAIGGLILGLQLFTIRIFAGIPEAIFQGFAQTQNKIAEAVENIVNTAIEGSNKLRQAVGADLIEPIKIDRAKVDTEYFKNYGETIVKSIDDGMKAQGGALETVVTGIFGRAKEIKSGRDELARLNAKTTGKDQPDLNKRLGDGGGAAANQKEIDKVTNALRALLNHIDPVSGALLEMAKAEKTLADAQRLGIGGVDSEKKADYLQRLKEYYKDILDPMGKVNRELETEAKLLNMSAAAREVETKVEQIRLGLIKSTGQQVSEKELNTLREKIDALRELKLVTDAQDSQLAATVGKRKDDKTQFQATSNLLQQKGAPGSADAFTKTDAFNQLSAGNEDLFKGTQAQLDANVVAYKAMYDKIDQLRQLNIISEGEAAQARSLVDVKAQENRLQFQQQIYGTLAQLANSGNKKLAAIGKAAAVVQATIDGTVAVQKALASAPPPYNYALAAAVGTVAAANVAQILGVGFEGGGFTGNGGRSDVAGVVHGQEFVMNADATAKNRPLLEALNDGKKPATAGGGGGADAGSVNVKVVNAFTREAVLSHLDNPDGHKIILNAITQNPDAVKQAIG